MQEWEHQDALSALFPLHCRCVMPAIGHPVSVHSGTLPESGAVLTQLGLLGIDCTQFAWRDRHETLRIKTERYTLD